MTQVCHTNKGKPPKGGMEVMELPKKHEPFRMKSTAKLLLADSAAPIYHRPLSLQTLYHSHTLAEWQIKDGDSSRRFEATATLHSIWGRRSWWIHSIFVGVVVFVCQVDLSVWLSLCVFVVEVVTPNVVQVGKFANFLIDCLVWLASQSAWVEINFSPPFFLSPFLIHSLVNLW